MTPDPLTKSFYERPTLTVAAELSAKFSCIARARASPRG